MAAAAPMHFDFLAGGNAAEHPVYDAAKGFGFEPSNPRRFSIRVPEGNYRVTVHLGGPKAAGSTTVLAEQRRLMLEELATRRRQQLDRSFIVNVRIPELAPPPANAPGGTAVRLKSREQGSLNWDDRLTLEFAG